VRSSPDRCISGAATPLARTELPAWARVEPWVAGLALGWCALRLGRGLGPEPFYNSDCAVPILLMQGMGEGAFAFYYPLQDRFGMWPFLLGRVLHLTSPEGFHVLSVLALCSAAFPLARLLGSPALGVVTLVLPLVLQPSVAWNLFQAGQPYLWQIVALLWAWWACRVALTGTGRAARLLGLAGFGTASALAAWMNTASLVCLLGVGALEVLGARAGARRALGAVVALGAAGGVEASIHARYNAWCQRVFGERFVTPLRIDHGHLLANVVPVLASLRAAGGLWPLLIGGAALAVPGRSRSERLNLLSLLAFACAVLPGFVLIGYFRGNDFAGRYFSFPAYWALAAAVYGLALLASTLVRERQELVRAVALGVLVLLVRAGPSDPLAGPREEARALAGAGPAVLLADYLEVYVPASLEPGRVLVPVGAEGNLNRYPETVAQLRPGRRVLVPCALDRPAGTLEQHGALLRRTGADPVTTGGRTWCVHAVERAARRAGP
jgi:hypothetical protein